MQNIIDQDQVKKKEENVLCCLCGASIPPNPASMCLGCIRSQVDITQDISKQEIISWCRNCERYLQPPKYWVAAALESKELLTICLKKLRGLQKVKLIDAAFKWTEPHSKRLKVKLTIQKEVFNGTKLQQSFEVEYVIKNQQCESCAKSFTPHKWVASVQVRQKVDHKRTFFFLEQLILKHKMHLQCINIKERGDGIDFYFSHRSHALKFNDFVGSVTPTKFTTGKRLISHDQHSNTFQYKYTFSTEIAPICHQDLVCLPKSLFKSFGSMGPLCLCERINASIHFIDPQTLRRAEVDASIFWKSNHFQSMISTRQFQLYYVIDVEKTGKKNGKYELAEVQISKEEDLGKEDKIICIKTHLGNILQPGDSAYGYDIKNGNFNDPSVGAYSDLPEVILVKKFYEKRKKNRNWKLRHMKKKSQDKETKSDLQKKEEDFEAFLDEIEEDENIKSKIDLFKNKNSQKKDKNDDTDFPDIDENELLDEDKVLEEEERLRKLKLQEKEEEEDDTISNQGDLKTDDISIVEDDEEEEEDE